MKVEGDATQAAISQQEYSGQYARIHTTGSLGRFIIFFNDTGITLYDADLVKTIHSASWDR